MSMRPLDLPPFRSSAEDLREAIATTRTLTGAPFGVNLFVPSAPGAPVQTQLLTGVIDVAQKSLRTAMPHGTSYTTWQDFIYAFGRLRSSEPWRHRCLRLQPDVEGVCPRWASPLRTFVLCRLACPHPR